MSFTPPTESELAAVARLKAKLDEEKPEGSDKHGFTFTDTAVLRFYRGRKQDEEKAYRALLRHLEWRRENDVDAIEERRALFAAELDAGKFHIETRDREGRPCIYVYAGKHDKNTRDLETMKQAIIYTLERILRRTRAEEERINICFDLSAFSYACMDYDVVKLLVNILQFNYPDTLHVALIIDSPFLFSACWAVIRPWLDPVTAAKVAFVRGEQLKDYLDETTIIKPDA